QFVGAILECNRDRLIVDVKNRFESGDRLQLMTTQGNLTFDLDCIFNHSGQTVDIAPGSGHVVSIPLPEAIDPAAIDEYSMLVRYLPAKAQRD
ncbi:MAG: U32 family peptidase, partial [Xanthomonadales bacterium]|nr:U32 family peptidase [Xanthomonadales bacterium]